MKMRKYLLMLSFMIALDPSFLGPSSAHKPSRAPTRHTPTFALSIWPPQGIAHHSGPIYIQVALSNVTNRDRYTRLWFLPCPFGSHAALNCLQIRCRNQITGKEVQYTWPPPGATVADVQGKEKIMTYKISPGKPVATAFDLRQFCVLPPGKYVLELQYDTRFLPLWIKPDKRAWHGATNRATVKIQVVK